MSVDLPVEIVALGVVTGLTYAMLGVGLTLVYRTSRVLNFAHGELGALPAIIVPVLVINQGLNYWVGLAAALAAATAGGALMERFVIRRLSRSSRLVALVATIGVAQLLFAINLLIPKEGRLGRFPFPTPFTARVGIGDLRLTSGHLIILIVVPVMSAGIAIWLKRSRTGVSARAAADNADAAELCGVPIRRVSFVVWTLAGLLAGASAILIGPTRPIATEVALGPALMVRALAAAMIGGLSDLRYVFGGGVFLGVVEAAVLWNYPSGGMLEVVLFGIILVSLLARTRATRTERADEGTSWSLAGVVRPLAATIARSPAVVRARRIGLAAAVTAAVLVVLPMSSSARVLMSSIVLFSIMSLSLVVLTGFAGQVSLGQFAFVGLGALVGGRLLQLGYPPWSAVCYAAAAGGLVALVVGLPALRLRGLFLAVTTLGFAVALQTWLYRQGWLVAFEGSRTSLEIPRPRLGPIDFQDELSYYFLCLAALVVAAAAVHRLRATGIGRAMMAVRDNAPQASALGISPARAKLTAFVLSGIIASVAGYLYGGLLVTFTDPRTFAPERSLALVAVAIVGGVTSVTGAVLGPLWVLGLGYLLAPILPRLLGAEAAIVIGGIGLLVVLLQFPGGIAQLAFHLRDRLLERIAGPAARPEPHAGERERLAPAEVAVDAPTLRAEDVVVRFGGNAAVAGVTIDVAPGEIVGLVGPNGAGKTTLFDVLSGHVRPDAGRVLLDGTDVTWMRPEERARLGLGRTFQQARLFDDLTLLDAVKAALEREHPSELVPSVLGLPPSRRAERAKQLRAEEVLELLGMRSFGDRLVSELSTGMRRLAELGCLVGLGARMLLLDEPTAGIAQREVEAFRPVLRELRDHLGATMVVIDHDIPMITGLADRVYVLAAGEVIAEGPPDVIQTDDRVVAAYLGTDGRMVARSGAATGGGGP